LIVWCRAQQAVDEEMFDRLDKMSQLKYGLIIFVFMEGVITFVLPKLMQLVKVGFSLRRIILVPLQLGIIWLYLIVLLMITRTYWHKWRQSLGKLQTWGMGILVACGSLLYDVVISLLKLPLPANQNTTMGLVATLRNSPVLLTMLVVTGVMVLPVTEELIFQYYFQGILFPTVFSKFSKSLQRIGSVACTTILFILYHGSEINMRPDILLLIFISYGDVLLFAIAFEWSNHNLIPVCLAHVLVNSVAFFLMLA
jgi:membrane protease YdiL (CAAX protease family)